jgi:hypothetical protein
MVGDGAIGTPYRHERAGFEITIPGGWDARSFPGPMVLVAVKTGSKGFARNLNVTLSTSEGALESYVDAELARSANFLTDLETVERESVTLAEHKSVRVLSHFRQGRFSIALGQWIVDDGDRVVTISVATEASEWDEARTAIRQTVESFRLLEEP